MGDKVNEGSNSSETKKEEVKSLQSSDEPNAKEVPIIDTSSVKEILHTEKSKSPTEEVKEQQKSEHLSDNEDPLDKPTEKPKIDEPSIMSESEKIKTPGTEESISIKNVDATESPISVEASQDEKPADKKEEVKPEPDVSDEHRISSETQNSKSDMEKLDIKVEESTSIKGDSEVSKSTVSIAEKENDIKQEEESQEKDIINENITKNSNDDNKLTVTDQIKPSENKEILSTPKITAKESSSTIEEVNL